MRLLFLADRRHSSAECRQDDGEDSLETQLLYQQKQDNSYFANNKKSTFYVQNSFFVSRKYEPLTPLLTSERSIPQHFAARPEESQSWKLPGSRGCSWLSSKVRKLFTLRKKCTGPTSAEPFPFYFYVLADAVLSTSKTPAVGKQPVLTCNLDFLNHLDFRHVLDKALLRDFPQTLVVSAWVRQLQLKPVLYLEGCWHSSWLFSGWQRKLSQHRAQEVFQDTPNSLARHFQPSPECNPAQPTGLADQPQWHSECFTTRAWDWHSSLRAPPLRDMSKRVSKIRVGRVALCQGRQQWRAPRAAGLQWDLAGLFENSLWGTYQALSRGRCRAFSFLCQVSGDPGRKAVTSPGFGRAAPCILCAGPWVQAPIQHTGPPVRRAARGRAPAWETPALHHPAADGFSQALGARLISPRPHGSPVTFSHVFMLVKATSEAAGHSPCCIAWLHTSITTWSSVQWAEASSTTRGAGYGPLCIRITIYQKRRSESFYLVIVGSADKLKK